MPHQTVRRRIEIYNGEPCRFAKCRQRLGAKRYQLAVFGALDLAECRQDQPATRLASNLRQNSVVFRIGRGTEIEIDCNGAGACGQYMFERFGMVTPWPWPYIEFAQTSFVDFDEYDLSGSGAFNCPESVVCDLVLHELQRAIVIKGCCCEKNQNRG